MLRIYDVGVKLLNGIKSMYVNNLICVKLSVSGSILFNVYLDTVMKEVKIRMGVRFLEEKRE